MTITYTVHNGLYVNLTNRCTCDCDFCERNSIDRVGNSGSLWLEREPTLQEILDDLAKYDLMQYDELIFCGFGEPTLRLDVILGVARDVKACHPRLPIRINTNGHANLIAGHDVTPDMQGLIDVLSISLNRPDGAAYERHMRPVYDCAFDGLLDFARRAKQYVPTVVLSVVDVLPEEQLQQCRLIAERLDVTFRVRPYHADSDNTVGNLT
ncbi:MAG: TatD family nuclease-associated radical SAM protein [Oscillospiraceae bacterium]|nr:TatD family nuclease-associated radical SAM protein [Oscillospiraceae bacterium]